MLTLITGTPGAGKSLYSVWEIAKNVPGSTIENGQDPVKRVLYSNVKGLLVEHEHITADELNTWHTWAKPGAVILFDEVQEVWRPRGISNKVPDSIAALETHRHMGVDIVLVTQHPMLLDQNIRRLVNQHLHLRRITKTVAMCYEWDHCSNPGTTKTCVNSRIWMHPKAAYSLYKSAQLHTKPKARIPGIAFVGLLALAGLAYAGPVAYDRIQNTFGNSKPKLATDEPKITTDSNKITVLKDGQLVTTETTLTQGEPLTLDTAPPEQSPASAPAFAGCIAKPDKCVCISTDGSNYPATQDECESKILGNSTKGQKTNDLRSVLSQYDPPSNQIHNDLDVYRFMDKR